MWVADNKQQRPFVQNVDLLSIAYVVSRSFDTFAAKYNTA